MGSILYDIVNAILGLLIWAIIISAILSWLVAFDIINLRNRIAYNVVRTLDAVTRPVLAPVQKIIPPLGGMDLSPIIVIIVLGAIQRNLYILFAPLVRLGDRVYASSGDFGPAFITAADAATGTIAWQERGFARASLVGIGDKLLIHTNKNAPNYKIVLLDLKKPQEANWKTIVPEGTNVLTDATMVGGHIMATYLKDAASQVIAARPSPTLAAA